MADDSAQNGTDVIATDHVSTLNGAAITPGPTTPKVQRVKVAYGDDGTAQDVSQLFPLPMGRLDNTVAGTISATDAVLGAHNGQGAVLTGTPTAGSYVAFPMKGGESGFTLRLSGTFGGGIVWIESSVDSTDGINGGWTTNLVRQSGVDVTFLDKDVTAPGIFRGVSAGYSYVRVRMTGATTPNVTAAFRASAGSSVTAQVASLPPGSNTIGAVSLSGSGGMTSVGPLTINAVGANTPGTASITSTAGQVVAATALAGNATFHLVTSAFNGTLIFEGSVDNGANYAPLVAVREDGTGAESSAALVITSAFIRQYTVALPGFTHFRVRASVFSTGSVSVIIAPGPFLIEPSPSLAASVANIGTVTVAPTIGAATAAPAQGTSATVAGGIGEAYITGAAAVASTALIVAPAAGLSIYVTDMEGSNAGAANTLLSLAEGATVKYARFMAASGGGFVTNLRTPWKLPAATALNYIVGTATTYHLTVNYFIGV